MNIILKKFKKFYGNKLILDIDYMNFNNNKIIGLVGSNGIGKTTLLNGIAGLDRAYNGDIYYDEAPFHKKLYQQITLVTQKPQMLRDTVYKNVEYPLVIRQIEPSLRKSTVSGMLKRFKISHLSNEKGHQLSGGEMQKVALARAMVFKPKLLLLDEPTSSIDKESIDLVEEEILNYHRENNGTIILVTHSMDQANRLCDDVISLD